MVHSIEKYPPFLCIARLDGSLMALNRTLAWEVLRAFCLMMPRVLGSTTSCGNATCGKKYFTKEFNKLQAKYSMVPRMDTCVKIKLKLNDTVAIST